jgi:hypothetical protein
MVALRVEAFDRDDLAVRDLRHHGGAGADGDTAKMDSAGAAQPLAASELGARQPEFIAYHPEQRDIGIAVIGVTLSVDLKCDHSSPPVC